MSMRTKEGRFHDAQLGKGTLGVRQRRVLSCRLCFRHGALATVTESVTPATVFRTFGTNRECL